ncbi:prepilin-type N-terminal cleavage/methylation domain-containing protein [Engelhardtia mirabilis]|uniref:Prepilin-type N-terminal cleavage/methylation domain-containing protein n=1 Tax=Engelhardtia mirabilis TaxID=2528011 RepID=A0A518BK05_9BACT|nr:hypothetical protein Pla133_23870 [Planctomycetes bacterium Pla133]QDV01633.1 hypothetical protein Pla86_23860 [Planctomycetes bacterium Pla86]
MALRRLIRAGAASGFSMIEMLFAISMLAVVLMAATSVGKRGGAAYDSSAVRTQREQDTQRALERALAALTGAASSTFTPTATGNLGTSDLSFRTPTAIDATGITWSAPSRLRLEYEPQESDDGTDEDGDGLVDEMRLVLITDEGEANQRMTILIDGVAELGEGEALNLADDDGDGVTDEPGFCIQRVGDVLFVQLRTIGSVDGAPTLSVALESRVELRN